MQFLNPAETTKILRALERYHIVFSKIFEFGYVSFDKSVPRACLRFNKELVNLFSMFLTQIFGNQLILILSFLLLNTKLHTHF